MFNFDDLDGGTTDGVGPGPPNASLAASRRHAFQTLEPPMLVPLLHLPLQMPLK